MLVRTAMSAPVRTIPADMTCAEAWMLFEAERIRRAPVVENDVVVAMVTDHDLFRVAPHTVADLELGDQHPAYSMPISSIASRKLFSVAPNDHLHLAAQMMLRCKVGGLPVINRREYEPELVGIITASDIFRLFVRRTMSQRGHRVVLAAPDKAIGELDPAAICVQARARLFDLAIYPADQGLATVVLEVQTEELQRLVDAFLAAGYEYVLAEKS